MVGSGYNTRTILSAAGAEVRNPRVFFAVRIDVRARRDSIFGFVAMTINDVDFEVLCGVRRTCKRYNSALTQYISLGSLSKLEFIFHHIFIILISEITKSKKDLRGED